MNGIIDVNTILMCLWFIVNALIGAVAYIYFYSIYDKKQAVRQLILAGIAGYIYFIGHSEYNFPNTLVTIVVGWFAPDFIEGIITKYKEKTGGGK